MKAVSLLFLLLIFKLAQAEPAYEVSCRAKAKEIAAETYRGCISENRSSEIERIRKEYQDKLKSLKDDYEKEIDELGTKNKSNSSKKEKDSVKNIAMKPASGKISVSDGAQMDIPEPIPVESINSTSVK